MDVSRAFVDPNGRRLDLHGVVVGPAGGGGKRQLLDLRETLARAHFGGGAVRGAVHGRALSVGDDDSGQYGAPVYSSARSPHAGAPEDIRAGGRRAT